MSRGAPGERGWKDMESYYDNYYGRLKQIRDKDDTLAMYAYFAGVTSYLASGRDELTPCESIKRIKALTDALTAVANEQ